MSFPSVALPQVAVIGAGDIGCGWAALLASAGWPVTVFDSDPRASAASANRIGLRARALVATGRAAQGVVEHGLADLQIGRSLLQAVQPAEWVIEAVGEELRTKQRVIESIDDVAQPEAIITSSSSGLGPTDVAGRARHQHRILIAHPLNPPEIIPVVEVIPGPEASTRVTQRLGEWLRALGRFPVTLRKVVPGFAVGRIAAALWREAIDLVLEGVIGVDDLDRAISLGPGLAWAAAGPHLSYHLAAGEAGLRVFLQQLLRTFEACWDDLADWSTLDPEHLRVLEQAVERAYEGKITDLRAARDRRLAAMLRALEDTRQKEG